MRLLVVVDMQNDFVTGPLGSPSAQAIVEPLMAELDGYDRIVFTQDTHYGFNYSETEEGRNLPVEHCLVGTEGFELIGPIRDYVERNRDSRRVMGVYEKQTFGSVRLAEMVSKIADSLESVTFVGVCTDICVISNALMVKAFVPNVPIYVIEGLTAASSPKMQREAIDVMKSCHVHVI